MLLLYMIVVVGGVGSCGGNGGGGSGGGCGGGGDGCIRQGSSEYIRNILALQKIAKTRNYCHNHHQKLKQHSPPSIYSKTQKGKPS